MAAVPVFKLGVLLIKQLTKPVANYIKQEAVAYPFVNRACITIGQFSNQVQTRMDVRMLGHDISAIKPLSDTQAVKRGAEFIGEAFIFSVGAALLVVEYTRQASDKAESSARDKQRSEMKQRLIRARFDALESESAALRAHLASLESKLGVTGTEEHVESAERAAAKARQHTHAMRKAAAGVAPVLAGEEEPQVSPALPSDAGTQTDSGNATQQRTCQSTTKTATQCVSATTPSSGSTHNKEDHAKSDAAAKSEVASEAAAAEALDAAAAAAAARVEALQERYDALKSDNHERRGAWGLLNPIISLPGQLWRMVSSGDTAGPVKGDVAAIWRGLPEHRVEDPSNDDPVDDTTSNKR